MRFVLDGYVVEVRAKRVDEERFTKDVTMRVMNNLSIYLDRAADRYNETDKPVSARICREQADEIYEKLNKMGFYK